MLARRYWHPSITDDVIMDAAERSVTTLDNPGFCLVCGTEADGCEPDMRNGQCEACGAEQVYGAAELLLMIV